MIDRSISAKLIRHMKQFPAVGVIGPRQSGKTTLAKTFSKTLKKEAVYLDLERPADQRKLSDPELYLRQHENRCVILDEVQRMPELFPLLRHLIDRRRKAGRFLLLGSASPELIRNASESLAGRIYYLETNPFNFSELAAAKNALNKHWFRGGFPGSFMAGSDAKALHWMDGFVRTYIERDLNFLFGVTFSPHVMFTLWRMLAHHHGQMWNAHSFSKGLDISPTTVNRYLDYLEGAFIVRRLAPFHRNMKKRLVKTPKVYIRDSGLVHYLLDIHSGASLNNHPQLGYSWEGYVVEQIINLLPRTVHPFYYRTHDGSEMDLVLVKGLKPVAAIEVKNSSAPSVTKGMMEAVRALNCRKNFIIYRGTERYPISKDVVASDLRTFLLQDLPKLI